MKCWTTTLYTFLVLVTLWGALNIAAGIATGDLKNISIGILFISYAIQTLRLHQYEKEAWQ